MKKLMIVLTMLVGAVPVCQANSFKEQVNNSLPGIAWNRAIAPIFGLAGSTLSELGTGLKNHGVTITANTIGLGLVLNSLNNRLFEGEIWETITDKAGKTVPRLLQESSRFSGKAVFTVALGAGILATTAVVNKWFSDDTSDDSDDN